MEVGEYGLTRGTCFLACRLELDAVVGLLWISGCVPRLADYSVFFVFDLFFLRTHTGWCMYEATSCLLYVSTGTEARPKERSDRGRFVPIGKKDSSYRGVYRVPLFNWSVCPSVCLSVCVSVCLCITFAVFTDCESCTRPISTNRRSAKVGVYRLCLLYTSPSPRD